jgi:HEAT repeat protein
MTAAVLLTAVTTLVPGGVIIKGGSTGVIIQDADLRPREPNPLAPSLPLLTKKEQAAIQEVIDRFIQYETGKLSAKASAKALADFRALGPEATFQLIEGLNHAANIESSCPAVIIARRLAMILGGTQDLDLLDFARENIGAGVSAKRHMNVIKDLKLACALRKGLVQRQYVALGFRLGQKTPLQMTVTELANAAGSERGPRLQGILVELEKRRGEQVLDTLGALAGHYEPETQKLARGLLSRHLSRQGAKEIRQALKADQAQVRAAAAAVAGSKRLPLGEELIALLNDGENEVRQAARQALGRLSKGRDFGPEPTAGETERAEAVRLWRAWWEKQSQQGAKAP